MGRNPAVVIVARHGTRLDAADKHWHLTSPTPYDPPLTYGGWSQCQALGARIAGILQTRQEEAQNSKGGVNGKWNNPSTNSTINSQGGKKQKIIIHSSPFLRCIQTSIAISAGIGQYETKIDSDESPFQSTPSVSYLRQSDAYTPTSHAAAQSKGLTSSDNSPVQTSDSSSMLPAKLRVDAFLGEWLSPDYYENITPPPSSVMMIASAKADLLRPAEDIRGADLSGSAYNDNSAEWLTDDMDTGHGMPIPSRTRAITYSSELRSGSHFLQGSMIQEESPSYKPPVPTYAISSSDNIPAGYVAHARDACVEVEYQWDSMREPLDWGNGGEYGEEWTSMHRRFRNGLQRMLTWYESQQESEEDENDADLVLVLVTHGAGCNALIGAMTNAPVLLDVGMASLTMAVRKENANLGSSQVAPSRNRRGSLDLGIADQFDMKIIASSEHLRSAANPLGPNSPRIGRSPAFAGRRFLGADSTDGFSIGDPLSLRPSSSNGVGRSASQRSFLGNVTGKSATGLWRRGSRYSRDETAESSESDSLPNFESTKTSHMSSDANQPKQPAKKNDENITTPSSQGPVRTPSQVGLWGSAETFPREENKFKRRWTFVETP